MSSQLSYNPIIDGDGLIVAISYSLNDRYKAICNEEGIIDEHRAIYIDKLAKNFIEKTVRDIFEVSNANRFIILCRGSNSYRKNINYLYKSNRTGERPVAIDRIRNILVNRYKAIEVQDIETDDACCITYLHYNTPEMIEQYGVPILAHIDKDMKQIPGNHLKLGVYGSTESFIYQVSEEEGLHHLLVQALKGDITDGIKALIGVGEGKANDILEGRDTKGRGDNTYYSNYVFEALEPLRAEHKLALVTLNAYLQKHGTINGLYEFATNFLQVFMLRDTTKKQFPIPNWINLKKNV